AGVVADATIVSNYCDAVLFVVAENKTSLREIEYAVSDLSTTKAEVFGCIYNNARRGILSMAGDTRGGYFSRSYSYSYSKSYGADYGQESNTRRK
ncbi:MAG TPA: hypothetical protein PKN28_05845, partial [Clostridiales bacterium]|nr:hypothetical protein [Clostridiales bacterium]